MICQLGSHVERETKDCYEIGMRITVRGIYVPLNDKVCWCLQLDEYYLDWNVYLFCEWE